MSHRLSRPVATADLMVTNVGNEAIRDQLQRALREALRARDKAATSALRSALAGEKADDGR